MVLLVTHNPRALWSLSDVQGAPSCACPDPGPLRARRWPSMHHLRALWDGGDVTHDRAPGALGLPRLRPRSLPVPPPHGPSGPAPPPGPRDIPQIEFPLYGRRRSNILESSNRSYLASCLYDEDTDPFCPVFKLDTIARLAGVNFSRVAVDGSIISVRIQWDCDLDHDFWTHCRPEYHFRRLDNADAKIAPGWNFRYAHYFSDQTYAPGRLCDAVHPEEPHARRTAFGGGGGGAGWVSVTEGCCPGPIVWSWAPGAIRLWNGGTWAGGGGGGGSGPPHPPVPNECFVQRTLPFGP